MPFLPILAGGSPQHDQSLFTQLRTGVLIGSRYGTFTHPEVGTSGSPLINCRLLNGRQLIGGRLVAA